MGLEPTTFCSEDRCSTIEPRDLVVSFRRYHTSTVHVSPSRSVPQSIDFFVLFFVAALLAILSKLLLLTLILISIQCLARLINRSTRFA